jgi:methionine biosynthesis protein MetW
MINLDKKTYAYLEEVNDGILKQFPYGADGSAKVLDVGCGSGALAEAIGHRGYTVWGIEQNEGAVAAARSRGVARVIQADLTDLPAVRQALGQSQFDYLVFSDVLEHIYDPLAVLNAYSAWLKPGGRLLVSVPNIAAWTRRLALLMGRFEYADTGVMDRTHIRFFTFATAKRLVRAAGFALRKVDYTPYATRAMLPLIKKLMLPGKGGAAEVNRRQMMDSPLFRFYHRWVYPVEYVLLWWWKSLFAFRIIVVGVKA